MTIIPVVTIMNNVSPPTVEVSNEEQIRKLRESKISCDYKAAIPRGLNASPGVVYGTDLVHSTNEELSGGFSVIGEMVLWLRVANIC